MTELVPYNKRERLELFLPRENARRGPSANQEESSLIDRSRGSLDMSGSGSFLGQWIPDFFV